MTDAIAPRQGSWSGPSATTTAAARKLSKSESESSSSPSSTANQPSKVGPVRKSPPRKGDTKRNADGKVTRKKVAKACLACQKSHLTCDENRPCNRCTKKGIGDQCVEGVRKKAKYLMEGDERARPAAPVTGPVPVPGPGPVPVSVPAAQPAAPPAAPPSFPSHSPPSHGNSFGHVPVSMLPGVVVPPPNMDPVRVPDNIWLTAPLPEVQTAPQPLDWSAQDTNPFNFTASAAANLEYEMFDSMFGSLSPSFPLGDLGNTTDASTPTVWSNLGLPDPANASHPPSVTDFLGHNDSGLHQALGADLSPTTMFPSTWSGNDEMGAIPHIEIETKPRKMTPEDVYRTVLKPYDYTEGYHILMQYLTQNFEKNDILRVVRALAAFRPSLIALQMPMSEDDEIFLERSFQRTLIELEKLISYSATPTAVWRRTGEIVCVSPEFCQLVGKKEEDIVRNRTCIYQLFNKAGTIEYWENFAEHAFENTTQNFFQATTLENDTKPVPCAACFTIRRDVFDLPSVIIGQFLPIPAEAMA
ncbi:hypothetical protein CcaverHIS002_0607960 [Cutaneotrichosporon cavernicola]|uniref:Transcription activator of gluconeogenesis ERT1 n=1 Tax=Cutaneotrichosporon cavernicola TaxID=279322 RepID=A0AA48L9A8_9TREE|nr:uncharacterized protein CcaverHIS019_0607410 [Cutaneotrichosporon cavernicola]BEI86509.1 hypothetical protein CcaverHIS002_0607960 [Cutaneotrichosporon cavernicola]BEI94282.1 hypothetical protein CcaverHIS019_0607410 [Cutaneotrichosporon cavernicola]